MGIRVTCPECEKVLQFREMPAAGKKVKCSGCSHIFVPPREEAIKPAGKVKALAKTSEVREDIPKKKDRASEEDEARENGASKKKKKKRRDEDENEDEEEVPIKKKKKKKKAGASNALYWVYRGGMIAALFVLLAVLVYILVFMPRRTSLNIESTVEVEPLVSRLTFVEPIASQQEVKVSATATTGQFNIYLFLEKDKASVESDVERGKTSSKVLDSKTKTSEASLKAQIPANETAVVMMTCAGKKVEVKLKITN